MEARGRSEKVAVVGGPGGGSGWRRERGARSEKVAVVGVPGGGAVSKKPGDGGV